MTDSRVVFITGGGRGIGAAAAAQFAAAGDRVAITARTESQLEATAGAIRDAGGDVLVLPGDIGDEQCVAEMVRRTVEHFGRLDVLVNNAVIAGGGDIFTCTPQRFAELVNVNLVGYYRCAYYCVPHMARAGAGVIVNVSSIMALMNAGLSSAYVACKGAVEAITTDWAVRLGPENIRVVCVRLGAIDTGITDNWAGSKENSRKLADYFLDATPLGRQGTADEAAAMIRLLASPEASYVHGATLDVDGGRCVAIYPRSLADLIPR